VVHPSRTEQRPPPAPPSFFVPPPPGAPTVRGVYGPQAGRQVRERSRAFTEDLE
ncbi:hypothetical protein FRC06_007986, partial [Ceratobasidium sp. 370]